MTRTKGDSMQRMFADVIHGSRWLMEPTAFRGMVARAESATSDMVQAAIEACERVGRPTQPQMVGDVAVIDICGPITYHRSWFSLFFGASTIEDMQAQFRAAIADPAVKAVAFRVDSPGGVVDMVPEFADEIYAARGTKPIVAMADTMICSAAYWIASQAETIYASPSAQIGSVGAFILHADISGMLEQEGVKMTFIQHGAHKTDGNPYEPLSDEVKAEIQTVVDEVGGEFDAAVARGRSVTKAKVLADFGQGKVFRGKKAISIGLADKLGTTTQALAKLGRSRGGVRADAHESAVDVIERDVPVMALEPKAPAGDASTDDQATESSEEQAAADRDALAIALVLGA